MNDPVKEAKHLIDLQRVKDSAEANPELYYPDGIGFGAIMCQACGAPRAQMVLAFKFDEGMATLRISLGNTPGSEKFFDQVAAFAEDFRKEVADHKARTGRVCK